MYALLLPLLLLVNGCATTENYEKVLQTWIGENEINLIRSWGAPVQSYEAGGVKFLVYSDSRNVTLPGVAPTYRTDCYRDTCYTNQSGGTSDTSINMNCMTTFEVKGSKISSWSYRGNDCTAFNK